MALTAIALATIPLGENLERARSASTVRIALVRGAAIAAVLAVVVVASSPMADSARDDSARLATLLDDPSVSDQRVIEARKTGANRAPVGLSGSGVSGARVLLSSPRPTCAGTHEPSLGAQSQAPGTTRVHSQAPAGGRAP